MSVYNLITFVLSGQIRSRTIAFTGYNRALFVVTTMHFPLPAGTDCDNSRFAFEQK